MEKIKKKLAEWAKDHYLQLAIYNVFLVLLVLLHSARYFDPFWVISINSIVFIGILAAVLLLGAGSRPVFLIALTFLVFSFFMRAFRIDVWAERASVYVFQAIFIGVLLLIADSIKIIFGFKKIGRNKIETNVKLYSVRKRG